MAHLFPEREKKEGWGVGIDFLPLAFEKNNLLWSRKNEWSGNFSFFVNDSFEVCSLDRLVSVSCIHVVILFCTLKIEDINLLLLVGYFFGWYCLLSWGKNHGFALDWSSAPAANIQRRYSYIYLNMVSDD